MKRPPVGWIADAIKNEIKKKYILIHEYKSIKDEAVKLQMEIEYKQLKMVVRKIIKKLKMQHYHEALKNDRTNVCPYLSNSFQEN